MTQANKSEKKGYQMIIARCDGVLEYTFPNHHPSYKEIEDAVHVYIPKNAGRYILYDWCRGDMTQGKEVMMMWEDKNAYVYSVQPSFDELEENEMGTELIRKFGGYEVSLKTICGPVAIVTLMP